MPSWPSSPWATRRSSGLVSRRAAGPSVPLGRGPSCRTPTPTIPSRPERLEHTISYVRPRQTLAELLEELRDIAQLGLNYTRDPFDRERYQRLLALTADQYAHLAGLPPEEVTDRFRAELGHISPKVRVDAAIFDDQGQLLLTRRADDGLWCLPCGWAELAESPQESLRREVQEETGLEVDVRTLLDIRHRLPGQSGPHTSYHILYHCIPTGGALATSEESLEVAYCDPAGITEWHKDHAEAAQVARDHWLRGTGGQGGSEQVLMER